MTRRFHLTRPRHIDGHSTPRVPARIAAAVLASATTTGALAQDQGTGDHTLPAVTVTGSALLPGLGIERKRLPYAVQTASDKTLKQSQSDTLTEFMARTLTGVNVNDIQGGAFQSDVTYRGFRASPILGSSQGMSVYLDGVRINEPFGDVVNWDMLPESAIASVSLVPGSNPIFGLNTLGGTIAFTTKSGRSHPGLEAELVLGSSGRKRLDLAYGKRGANENGIDTFIAATVFDESGWREHAGGRLGNLFAKIGSQRGATQWDASLLHGVSRLTGNGLLPSYRWADGTQHNGLYEDNPRAAYTYPDRTENRLTQLAFSLRHSSDETTELAASVYLRSSRRDGINADVNEQYSDYVKSCAGGFTAAGNAADPASCSTTRAAGSKLPSASLNRSATRQESAGLGLNLTRYLDKHQFTLGAALDANRVSYSQSGQDGSFTPDRGVVADPTSQPAVSASVAGRSHALGIYAMDTWKIAKRTHLTASARFNHVVVSNTLGGRNGGKSGDQPNETFTYNKLNPALGIAHDAGAGLTLFGNIAQSNRVPTVIELGCADPAQPCRLPVGLQSDPYLNQVVSRTVEAGAHWQPSAATSLTVSAYRTHNHNDILFFTAGSTQQGYFANFERTKRQGIDLSASHRFGAVTAHLAYSFLDASYDATGLLFTGQRNVGVSPGTPIAGLPRNTLKLGLEWQATPKLTLGGNMLAVSSLATQGNEDGLRADNAPGEKSKYADWRIRGYAVFNLHGSYRSDDHWEFFARVNNLLDRRYETYGLVARDVFPNGQLLQPHVAPMDAGDARFVAPGAARTVLLGVRYKF